MILRSSFEPSLFVSETCLKDLWISDTTSEIILFDFTRLTVEVSISIEFFVKCCGSITETELFDVNIDGSINNEVQLATGNINSATAVTSLLSTLTYGLYVPYTILPDLTYRIRLKIYAAFINTSGTPHSMSIHFRGLSNSNLYTTIFVNQAFI